MKNLIFTFTLLILGTFSLMAQITPQSFKYQGVARDNGMVVTGGLSLQISIRSASTNGAIVYQERQFPTTNDYGVFSVEVGGISAIVTQGDFEAIDWSTGEYFMQVGLDPSGGASFNDMGTTQLASVPFALFAETARTAIDDNDTDPTNEIQGLSLNGTILEIDNGNMVDLAPIISQGDDDQNLILSGTNLSIENGNAIDLSVIQDGVTDADSDPSNEIQDLTLTLTGTVLSIEDGNAIDLGPVIPPGGTDDQNLSISGNTLSIEGGNSVDLSVVQDGTEDADADPNNEIQTLSLSGTSLSIQDGNTVDLSVVQDGVNDADADPSNELQDLTLTGTVIQIENGNSIDLAPVIPPGGTDDQNLMLSGTSLTIEDGNTIDLAPIIPPGGTDDQNLTLNGNSLTIEDGNTVILNVNDADADPDNELQDLTLTGTVIQIENGNAIDLAPIIPPGGTDDQNLTLSGTNLTIEDGNTIDLAPIIPPGGTDDQNLILNGSNLAIEDGNIVDMSSFLDNTDAQDLSLNGNTLNLTNDGTPVDLSGYLDNTDAQDLSLSGNNLNLTNDGTPVDLSGYLDNTDTQNLANVLDQGNSANSKITNLTNPTNAQDAATKNYVDTQVGTIATDLIMDATDGDTKIQTVESGNQDFIRFDLEGTEFAKMDGKTFHLASEGHSVFIGNDAGKNDDGTDNYNTFIGEEAGKDNTSGSSNTFVGSSAGPLTTSGNENTFVGSQAGLLNEVGARNTMLGHAAGNDNIGGDKNTFLGAGAGKSNVDGNDNTMIGEFAGAGHETGSRNVFIGSNAGNQNTNGTANVFIGNEAGYTAQGSNKLYIENSDSNNPLIYGEFDNDILGFNARVGVNHIANNNTMNVRGISGDNYYFHTEDPNSIGLFSVQGDGNVYVWNKLGIGGVFSTPINELDIGGGMVVGTAYAGNNTAPQNGVLVEGNVGIGTTTPTASLHIKQQTETPSGVGGIRLERPASSQNWKTYIDDVLDYNFAYNGTLKAWILDTDGSYHNSSDRRLKKNITPLPSVLSRLLELRPMRYHFLDTPDDATKSFGLIAQEVQPLFPDVVGEKNGYLSMNYGALGIIAIKAIQEQQVEIENQNAKIELLEKENAELKARMDKLEALIMNNK